MKMSIVGDKIRQRVLDGVAKTDLDITVDFDGAFYNEFNQRMVNLTCNKDGTTHQRKLEGLYNGVFICPDCDYRRYENKAKENNVKLLSKSHNGKNTVVELQCPICNDVFKRHSPTFFNNDKYHCFNCVKVKYTEILKLKGCTYISHSIKDNGTSKIVYSNVEDVIREVSSTALCNDQWVASLDESWWEVNRRTYVYKFTFRITDNYLGLENGEYFKIGSSSYPERRLEQLDLVLPVCIETIACAKTSKDIRIVEEIIRGYYNQYKLPKDVPPTFTKGLSKRRLKDGTIHYKADGATEWIFVPD